MNVSMGQLKNTGQFDIFRLACYLVTEDFRTAFEAPVTCGENGDGRLAVFRNKETLNELKAEIQSISVHGMWIGN